MNDNIMDASSPSPSQLQQGKGIMDDLTEGKDAALSGSTPKVRQRYEVIDASEVTDDSIRGYELNSEDPVCYLRPVPTPAGLDEIVAGYSGKLARIPKNTQLTYSVIENHVLRACEDAYNLRTTVTLAERDTAYMEQAETIESLRRQRDEAWQEGYRAHSRKWPCTCDHSESDVIVDQYCPHHGSLTVADLRQQFDEANRIRRETQIQFNKMEVRAQQAEADRVKSEAVHAADKERLDWMDQRRYGVLWCTGNGMSIREAIDKARKK